MQIDHEICILLNSQAGISCKDKKAVSRHSKKVKFPCGIKQDWLEPEEELSAGKNSVGLCLSAFQIANPGTISLFI